MDRFTFENQGTNTYLVYEVAPTDRVDTMSLGMLTNNKISGLAPTLFMQVDTTKYIKYNVSAHVSAKQFFTGPVNRKRLIGVFSGIVDAMLSAEDYMIDTDTILLDLDYIFADVSTCETVLICLPIIDKDAEKVDLGTFFKSIVFSTQFDQTENCDYVAKIINYLNSTPVFSLNDFSKLLKEIAQNQVASQQSAVQQVKTQPTVQSVVQPSVQTKTTQQPVVKQEPPKQVVQQESKKVVSQVQSTTNPGFTVPSAKPAQNVAQQNAQSQQETTEDSKKISMFYLLQHYNKENAAAYKAQKEAKKGASKEPKKANKKEKVIGNQSFTVPGASTQPSNVGFAIPGQQAQPPVTPVQQMVHRPSQPVAQQPVKPQQTIPASPILVGQSVQPTPVQAPSQPIQTAPKGQTMNFGETTVLNAATYGETTVLNAGVIQQEVKLQPYLIRAKNNERIALNKPVFRIGKEKSYVDYFISDNTAISRSHANVISRDDEYFVVDTNSTNHTYVNGMMIQSNVETKIVDGAKIRLANEEFEFKLK